MKSFKKFFSILFVCVLLSFTVCSDYISCYNVEASGVLNDISNDIMYYFLSVTGSIDRKNSSNLLNDAIQSLSNSVRNTLLDHITDQITNGGIYEDNGNIVFSSSAMADFYSVLNGGNSSDFRVVNDFSKFNIYGDPSYSNYVDNRYLESVNDYINGLTTSYAIYIYNRFYSNRYYETFTRIYPLNDNIAYIYKNRYNVPSFFNSSGNNVYFYTRYIQCVYDSVNDTFNTSGGYSNTGDLVNSVDSSLDYTGFYTYFPEISYTGIYHSYYFPSSILLCNSSRAYYDYNNQSTGIYYFNNYNNITVEKNIITNNNWSSIYNSYVTNVSNTYNTEVTNNNGSDLTAEQIRQIMNTYLQPIYNAIDEGLTDIAEKVNYINEWLSKIYTNGSLIITRLDSIIQIIQQNTGGSGSTSGTACAWSDQEVDIVLDKLSRIYTEQVDNDLDVIAALEYIKTKISSLDTTLTTASSNISSISSNTSSIVTSLDTELSRLATVLTKMDTIISKMGQNRITRPTVDPDIIDDLEDLLPESVLDDIFSPFAALGSIIETVVPFCYIGVAVAIMSNLSADAEAPYWEIPFKYDSDALALHIDEKIVIDLSPFEDLSTILRLLFIIAFTISLMFFSLPLVNYMTGIFSGR